MEPIDQHDIASTLVHQSVKDVAAVGGHRNAKKGAAGHLKYRADSLGGEVKVAECLEVLRRIEINTVSNKWTSS